MSNPVTVVTNQGWFSRLGGAFKGILFGIVMVCAAFVLLFWNEGRAVKEAKSLREGAAAVVSVDSASVDPAMEGKLLHLSGKTAVTGILQDAELGVSQTALRLRRDVEMFQWRERSESKEEKNLGGSTTTTTTHSYQTQWSSRLEDSSSFQDAANHRNPSNMPLQSRTWDADQAQLGAFELGSNVISRLGAWETLAVQPEQLQGPVSFRAHQGDWVYSGNPANPQVGDIRLQMQAVPDQLISVVAGQQGTGLNAWPTRAGNTILLVSAGQQAAGEMFASAQAGNKALSWMLRAGGFVMMWVGLMAIFRPLSVLADVLPILGTLVGKGVGFICLLIAGILSLVAIAIAWIVYRPLLAVALLAVAAGLVYMIWQRRSKAVPVAGETAPLVS